MKITPLLDPPSEFREFMQVNACSPIELLRYEGHVIQWGLFLESQCFGFLCHEAVKEELPDPHPLRLHERSLKVIPVIDLEHMLKVLPPPTAVVLGG